MVRKSGRGWRIAEARPVLACGPHKLMSATARIIRAPRLLNARALETVTNPPGLRRGEKFSQDTCKIWLKLEDCAAIGYHHLLRIASNSLIQARIRIGPALRPTKI